VPELLPRCIDALRQRGAVMQPLADAS